MHKCPKCGNEFEGNFCPNCGEQWQEEKTCPNCGAILNGSAKFCNECGYSFYKKEKQTKSNNVIKEKLVAVWLWIKKHWKIIVPIGLAIILAIVLGCSIPACIKAQPNGTYYKINYDGEPDKTTYFILKSGKWTDEDGESGTYKKDGDKIVFYSTFFGKTEEICSGTLKNYVLTVNGDSYISEKHKHSFSNWETTQEVTCLVDGVRIRTCACGVKETQIIECIGYHTGDWQFDYDNHWKTCTVCGTEINDAHEGETHCTACDFPLVDTVGLSFIKNSGGKDTGYSVAGIGTVKDSIIRIPASYNNLPVTAISDSAFKNCSNLIYVFIPDSITSISDYAFRDCNNLKSFVVNEGNVSYQSIDGNLYSKDGETLVCYATGKSAQSFTIPDSVTTIGSYAFYGCSNLKSIIVNEDNASYQSIDGNLYSKDGETLIWYATGKSAQSFTVPDSVTSISDWAFFGCDSLTNVTIPDSVTSIGKYAFKDCINLTRVTFANTSGWMVSTSSSFSDSTMLSSFMLTSYFNVATYLTSTYSDYYWKCG